jgi:hypothetical protein
MESRDLALVAILLAIGAVLYMFTPNIGVVTPDQVSTFAALAIMLVLPKLWPSLGIGVVAGLLGMFFSKSSIAWFNIPSHILSCLCASLVAAKVGELKTGPISWKPAAVAIAYGVPGGGSFITALLLFGIFPFQVYITAGWAQVFLTVLSSIVIDMILYPPAKALYERTG